MAGRTRTQLRQLTARQIGLDVYRTGTADSSGSTTTLLDAPLKLFPDDYFNTAYIYLTSGSPSATELYITDFVQSTGVATFTPTLSAAPDTLTYEILPFSPTLIHQTIDDVLTELAQEHVLEREFWIRGIVIGSPIYNAGCDYWTSSSVLDGYYATTATLTQTTVGANTAISRNSVNLGTAAGVLTLNAAHRHYLGDFLNQTVTGFCWVKATDAANARFNLYTSTDNYSGYHTGGGGWELLKTSEIDVGTTTTPDSMYPQLVTATTTTAYFADWWMQGQEKPYMYPFPSSLMPTIDRIWYSRETQRDADPAKWKGQQLRPMDGTFTLHKDEALASEAGMLVLRESQPSIGTRLFIEGRGPLTIPITDSGVVEVTAEQALIVSKRAAIKLLSSLGVLVGSSQWRQVRERINVLRVDLDILEEADDTNPHVAVLPFPKFGLYK